MGVAVVTVESLPPRKGTNATIGPGDRINQNQDKPTITQHSVAKTSKRFFTLLFLISRNHAVLAPNIARVVRSNRRIARYET